jgi:hypothetical protein
MELSLYLDQNHCNKVYAILLPTLGKHTKPVIKTIQSIAAVNKELNKPHLHQCLAKLKAIDPNFSLEVDFFDPIHNYDNSLENEKNKLILSLKKNMDIKKALNIFREENEKNCKMLIDLYEVKIDRERLDKFMRQFSLPSSYL